MSIPFSDVPQMWELLLYSVNEWSLIPKLLKVRFWVFEMPLQSFPVTEILKPKSKEDIDVPSVIAKNPLYIQHRPYIQNFLSFYSIYFSVQVLHSIIAHTDGTTFVSHPFSLFVSQRISFFSSGLFAFTVIRRCVRPRCWIEYTYAP